MRCQRVKTNVKRVLVLSSNYPNEASDACAFVHARCRRYLEQVDLQVVTSNPGLAPAFVYEGVRVQNLPSRQAIVNFVKGYRPDVLVIHIFWRWMFRTLVLNAPYTVLIWVHGGEALGWYRRLFHYMSSLQDALRLLHDIPGSFLQMACWHRMLSYSNRTGRVHTVFVSQWMRKILERDSMSRIRQASVIPNPIDGKMFPYRTKTPGHRNHILVLRSFASSKYAGDMIVNAICELSHRPCFPEIQFTIRGWGELFDSLTVPLRCFPNVRLMHGHIEQRLIPDLHAAHGVFLCPTRQDAQGVSMCEAMASGLVPVASPNTAIPEFVTHGYSGLLPRNATEIADAIEFLHSNSEEFLRMSRLASESIMALSGADRVIKDELRLIEAAHA